MRSSRAVPAGLVYVAIVFAAGFGFGIVRELLAARGLDRATMELFEIPIVLAISYVVCGRVLRQMHVGPNLDSRLVMGTVALAVLLLLEIGVGMLARGLSLRACLAHYGTVRGIISLGAYLAFASIPVWRK